MPTAGTLLTVLEEIVFAGLVGRGDIRVVLLFCLVRAMLPVETQA